MFILLLKYLDFCTMVFQGATTIYVSWMIRANENYVCQSEFIQYCLLLFYSTLKYCSSASYDNHAPIILQITSTITHISLWFNTDCKQAKYLCIGVLCQASQVNTVGANTNQSKYKVADWIFHLRVYVKIDFHSILAECNIFQ